MDPSVTKIGSAADAPASVGVEPLPGCTRTVGSGRPSPQAEAVNIASASVGNRTLRILIISSILPPDPKKLIA